MGHLWRLTAFVDLPHSVQSTGDSAGLLKQPRDSVLVALRMSHHSGIFFRGIEEKE